MLSDFSLLIPRESAILHARMWDGGGTSSGSESVYGSVTFNALDSQKVVPLVGVTSTSFIQATIRTEDVDMIAVVVTSTNNSFTIIAKPSAPAGAVKVDYIVKK